mgnify:FL=1
MSLPEGRDAERGGEVGDGSGDVDGRGIGERDGTMSDERDGAGKFQLDLLGAGSSFPFWSASASPGGAAVTTDGATKMVAPTTICATKPRRETVAAAVTPGAPGASSFLNSSAIEALLAVAARCKVAQGTEVGRDLNGILQSAAA